MQTLLACNKSDRMSSRPQGVYIAASNTFVSKAFLGVARKVRSQMKVLSSTFDMQFDERHAKASLLITRILKALPWVSFNYSLKVNKAYRLADFVYLRFDGADRRLVKFFRLLKHIHPQIQVIVEFPNWPIPYEEVLASPLHYFAAAKTRKHMQQLASYIDLVLTYSDDNEILGRSTMSIMNGIDTEQIPMRIPQMDKPRQISLIAISAMQHWHGYERLLMGLANYYANGGERDIHLNMVGQGPMLHTYKSIVNDYGLSSHVTFHGPLLGDDLDTVFNQSRIGILSLGVHRIGLHKTSELKSREYLARGLPMIGSCSLDLFPDGNSAVYLRMPANDSALDVRRLINFHDSIFSTNREMEVVTQLRLIAEQKIDMTVVMRPVLDAILERIGER